MTMARYVIGAALVFVSRGIVVNSSVSSTTIFEDGFMISKCGYHSESKSASVQSPQGPLVGSISGVEGATNAYVWKGKTKGTLFTKVLQAMQNAKNTYKSENKKWGVFNKYTQIASCAEWVASNYMASTQEAWSMDQKLYNTFGKGSATKVWGEMGTLITNYPDCGTMEVAAWLANPAKTYQKDPNQWQWTVEYPQNTATLEEDLAAQGFQMTAQVNGIGDHNDAGCEFEFVCEKVSLAGHVTTQDGCLSNPAGQVGAGQDVTPGKFKGIKLTHIKFCDIPFAI